MQIRKYQPDDEKGWVRCRTLAFLDTAYFDDVMNKKETYDHPAIELVAVDNGKVIGLLDIEYETKEKTVCTRGNGLGGMIWHLAAHPDYQRQGIGSKLLQKAEKISKEKGLNYLEAWTRDDDWVCAWYEKNGFQNVYSYLHVYAVSNELDHIFDTVKPGFYPVKAFAHYTGNERETIQSNFKRVHECRCYIKYL